jgi:hypothetical protein
MMREYPEAGFCCGIAEWRCMSTGMTWYMGGNMGQEPCYLSPEQMIRLGRTPRVNLCMHAALFRRDALAAAGGWKPELRWCCDCFTTFVIAFRHGMCFVPEVLSTFYLHPNSYYRSDPSRRQTVDQFLRLLESEDYADVSPAIAASGSWAGSGGRWRASRGGATAHGGANLAFGLRLGPLSGGCQPSLAPKLSRMGLRVFCGLRSGRHTRTFGLPR